MDAYKKCRLFSHKSQELSYLVFWGVIKMLDLSTKGRGPGGRELIPIEYKLILPVHFESVYTHHHLLLRNNSNRM
ncbi:hypothetical protein DGG96_11430 [Legionella qingyii]|uniref:Uncharacterized protein n=1 Tax=Legionella qingyii TaxID=2184757 RepID=A0A317U1A5_9GAMM|nr:hypothetical protein [Legionella qingyii]PWY54569.1 hypothetical protein DGG96_16300 [Legionella qingyii]PWY55531.1 hypothetical protein DGG96_11430 [Legionella qingyii]